MYLELDLFHTTEGDEWDTTADRRVVLEAEDYKELVFALRKANTPESRALARRLHKCHTGISRCSVCGTMSYTTMRDNFSRCGWCMHESVPEWHDSPSTYGHPCRKPYRSKGEKENDYE